MQHLHTSCTNKVTDSQLRGVMHPSLSLSVSVSVDQRPGMELMTLCTIVASLRVFPSRTQFFQYESIRLSCGDASEWRVKRNTSTNMNAECSTTWGKRNESLCLLADSYPVDTGVYWCESGAGECSSAVNITVTGGSVILESPVLPVPEGENVTLRCTNKMTVSSNITAEFYKNGLLIGNSSSGNLSILSVLKSDEGLYKCSISGAQSPDSWLAVRAGRPESFHSPLAHILLPVVGVCLLLVVVILLLLWRSRKGQSQVVGSPQPIIAAPGDDVILPCHVVPQVNVAGLTVEWSRPDIQPDPKDRLSRVEYVHLYRDTREDTDMKLSTYVRRTELFTDGLRQYIDPVSPPVAGGVAGLKR
uniref:Ig-like domain-containing protein n=1 Tax=Dicentrarchus labrax TaxID=13489 RepID=A0A8P4KRG6_DICLA